MIKMPIKRKICKIGNSFAIFLPKSWIYLLEEKHGKIEAVEMEVNGILTIKPILAEESSN
jgi:antitoxin component of MazEF toxin-antitoxin module